MKTLNTEQLESLNESSEDFALINVLDPEAFEQAHIPGSVNIPVSQTGFLGDVADKVTDKDQRIVVYCADEECPASGTAADKLESAGYTNVYDYEGGVKAWREAGKPIESA